MIVGCVASTALFDLLLVSSRGSHCLPGRGPRCSERHLRHVLGEYLHQYNEHRPHRGLDLAPPRPDAEIVDLAAERRIRRKP
jgi:hypothetical protein